MEQQDVLDDFLHAGSLISEAAKCILELRDCDRELACISCPTRNEYWKSLDNARV